MSAEWVPWFGLPNSSVTPQSQGMVDVKLRNGQYLRSMCASALMWGHDGSSSDIVFFRQSELQDRGHIGSQRAEPEPIISVGRLDPRITHGVLTAAVKAASHYNRTHSFQVAMLAGVQAALARIDADAQARAGYQTVTVKIDGSEKIGAALDRFKRDIARALPRAIETLKRISKTNLR